MSLMQLIKDYDRQNQEDFEDMERELTELREKVTSLTNQLVDASVSADRTKLDLILSGCLVHPNEQRERVTIDRKLFLQVTDTLRGCLNYLPFTGRAEVRQLIDQLEKTGDNT